MQLINQYKKRVFSGDVTDAGAFTEVINATGLSALSFGVNFVNDDGADVALQVYATNDDTLTDWAEVGDPTALSTDGYTALEILQPGMNYYRVEMYMAGGTANFTVDALGKGFA